MGHTYFFTGFPGFITANLLHSLCKHQSNIDHIYLLTLRETRKQAEQNLTEMNHNSDLNLNKITILEGDITKENLNIQKDWHDILFNQITHFFHLAAVYDLAVEEEISRNININGTHQVNQFIKKCHHLERYIYFSTAFISGTREGIIYEHELDQGQSFKNYYEQSKFEAEKLVEDLKDDVPTTIIRPSIVIGHSKTGVTSKFDGPYMILNYLTRLRYLPVIPYLGTGEGIVNMVPIDYVLDAVLYLAHSKISVNKTYHITDPNPYQAKEIYQLFMKNYLGKKPTGPVPFTISKKFLSFSSTRKWLKVEKEALDYFNYRSQFDCTNAINDLHEANISCPNLTSYIPKVIEYYKQNRKQANKHILIE
ncbi:SDR family oxidoreductase [Alkalibacillus aidingensis]|uniref:SDR family oxidoreductase n=1 Tax=Alkalibacillus aidingensis TaxID=2747607 RepID=UPI0016609C8D|nr:SDR family oxidoreductase [Alkalibacillus aidingensis]